MKNFTYIVVLFSTLLLSSCESQSPNVGLDGSISLGSNFGFCFGPCFQEMRLNKSTDEVIFEVKFRKTGGEQTSEIFKDKLSDATLSSIAAEVDFNLIKSMDEIYGCPDCADGGSEWIEINTGSGVENVKRVTFEYGKAPKEIEKLVDLLRLKKEELSTKYIQTTN